MATVTAFAAKTHFGRLLDRVSRGGEIIITRHEKPVAGVVPEGRPALCEIREAAGELRALRREMAKRRTFKPLSDREIRAADEAGRPRVRLSSQCGQTPRPGDAA